MYLGGPVRTLPPTWQEGPLLLKEGLSLFCVSALRCSIDQAYSTAAPCGSNTAITGQYKSVMPPSPHPRPTLETIRDLRLDEPVSHHLHLVFTQGTS